MAKNKVKYGKKDVLPAGPFDPKKSKVRISLLLDGDVLEAYKTAAASSVHGEYQTLMKEKLREAIFGKHVDPALLEVIRETVREELKKVS
jgi:uncharacterized protein (DUF4415 family)